jgi:sugar phosphate isomerase/epimerase
MTTRREFLTSASALAAGVVTGPAQGAGLDRLGVGLFTIPTMLERDFAGTMKTLAAIGYKEIETFGPYPFSAASAQERWKTVSASLNFKGSGYFGLSSREVKAILDGHGLTSPSMHTDLDSLRTKLEPMAEAAHVIGQRYLVLPAIPEAERRNLDGYKRMAGEFNRIGARAAALGLRFAYHNHGYGLVPMEGRVPFEVIADGTDRAFVDLQMDLYWTTAGGADPVAYLRRFAGRYVSVHVKDMAKRVRFAGDGGDSAQWIELFPYIADAGAGVLDLAGILAEARRAGVRHFFLERDQTPTPDETLRASYRYLSGLRLG